MFFVRCAAQCSRSVCWRRSVSHICFALASCYRSEWTIRAVTRARHSIGTTSEELHLKSTTQKDHRWLMALWRNPVISLGYLVFSGGQIWRTSDCFSLRYCQYWQKVIGKRPHVMFVGTWGQGFGTYLPCIDVVTVSFLGDYFFLCSCQQVCTIFSFSEQLMDMWTVQELLSLAQGSVAWCRVSGLQGSYDLYLSTSETAVKPAATPCSSGHSWLCHYACSMLF